MKHLLLSLLLVAFSVATFAQDNEGINVETRIMGPFTKIKTSKGINVTLIEGTSEKVEINIKNALTSDVITTLENKMLTVKMKTLIRKGVAVTVYITYNTLSELQAGSGSYIETEGVLTSSNLLLSVGTESVVQLEVDVTKLTASVAAGRIEIAGNVKALELEASTGGDFNGQSLKVENATVKASTGGVVNVNATNSLEAKTSSGGKVNYYGKPRMTKFELSGGKIEPAVE